MKPTRNLRSAKWRAVLRYSHLQVSQAKILRAYCKWRRENGIPGRCDNEECRFHTQPLEWNGKPLSLMLDHREGNRLDNSPQSLRLLCPNCNSQQPTQGGANRVRRRDVSPDGYTLMNRDGSRIVAARGFA